MYLLSNKKEECTGCTACMNVCPKNAIQMREDEEGFLYPKVDEKKCIDCKLCQKVCECNKDKKEKSLQAYGLKLKDLEARKSSSSGGAFTALSDYILNCSGIVYGAAFDEKFNVIHKRAENQMQRDELKKSKYVQSDLKNIFKDIKQDLESGKTVLFTGTPCQVDGLKRYLYNVDITNLYTCDLICHGVPSPKVYKDYLNYITNNGKKEIKKFDFRDKKYGWGSCYETYEYSNNKKNTDLKYREIFYSDFALRTSCYECNYSNLNRVSDITIGDFWGIEKKNINFKDTYGVSLIIINSQKGKELFEKIKSCIEYIKVDINDSLQHNLVKPTEKPKEREEFWKFYLENNFEKVLKKYVPKIYDRNVNKYKWYMYRLLRKLKVLMNGDDTQINGR